jgi:hypothetical protein
MIEEERNQREWPEIGHAPSHLFYRLAVPTKDGDGAKSEVSDVRRGPHLPSKDENLRFIKKKETGDDSDSSQSHQPRTIDSSETGKSP